MQSLTNYFILNWEVIVPLFLLFIEVFLRKIPTFSNISLVHYFNLILDFFVHNNINVKPYKTLRKYNKGSKNI